MTAHRFWRVEVANSTRTAFVAKAREVEFRATVGGSNLVGSGTALASSGTAAQAFDGSAGTVWTASSAAYSWVGYDFGAPVDVAEVVWTPDANYSAGLAAVAWIEWSDDGVSWCVTDASVDLSSAIAGTPIAGVVGSTVTIRSSGVSYLRLNTSWPSGSLSGRFGAAFAQYDPVDGGPYHISGFVTIAGSPDTPVRRRVSCFAKDSRRLVREIWSDAATGAYEIRGVRGQLYILMAEDYLAIYDAAAHDFITPAP